MRISRRAVLQGASGTAIALPFLEIMGEGQARAAAPKRFVICYAGVSLTEDTPDGPNNQVKFLRPQEQGENYDLPRDLAPLGKAPLSNKLRTFKGHDVQDEVSIVSGLTVPWATSKGASPPEPAGRPIGFHGSTIVPILAGLPTPHGPSSKLAGASADQIVAEATGKGTRFPLGLQYQVQRNSYEGTFSQRGDICFRKDSAGKTVRVGIIASPQAAFNTLFTNFQAPATSAFQTEARKAQEQVEKRKMRRQASILDLVLCRAARLRASLGQTDRVRLERHFEEIRALEKRVAEIPQVQGGANCRRFADPGPDPATSDVAVVPTSDGCKDTRGWSDEDKRGEVLRELLYMGLTCDLTRVGTLLITYAQSYMSAMKINGRLTSVHNSGHMSATADEQAEVIAWHVEQYAALVRKLKDTMDVDGSRMIDNTVVLMVTEGGAGYDPDGKLYNGNHSSEHMSVLVAGGRALGLRPGRHIAKGNQAHPANVVFSAMKAVGVDAPLGNITSGIPELL